jgi:hypothetical protein
MANTSKLDPMKRRDVAYYRQRQKNHVFTALVAFFAEEAERRGVTKKQLAEALSKEPSQITRWLSAPSNFELDTLSDLLLALGAEMDHRIVRFTERAQPNYAHPLIAKYLGAQGLDTNPPPQSAPQPFAPSGSLSAGSLTPQILVPAIPLPAGT